MSLKLLDRFQILIGYTQAMPCSVGGQDKTFS